MARSALILGIESSCDETAAAVVRSGEELLSNVVASQFSAHQPYGGVVPELAAREHLRAISPVVRKALAEANVSLKGIDAIAVTQGPGLAGALLVGITYAKSLAFALNKPMVAVNHLEGHIHAVLLEERQRGNHTLNFPLLALVVSGGHTHLYLAEERSNHWTYQNIGHTRDDAAGEAFDKVAKLLGLGYPGGPLIDALSQYGNPDAVKFAPVQLKGTPRNISKKRPDREAGAPAFDFSYSGMKTAVLRYVEAHGLREEIAHRTRKLADNRKPSVEEVRNLCSQPTLDLIASFQKAVVADLVNKTLAAARDREVATLFVTGGVAANSELRTTFEREAGLAGLRVFFPSRKLSTDNAAMIAAAAYPKFLLGQFADEEFSAEASMPLR
ncbi:MAG TPA: tRNA (adenosine(37)-N6)-threonylcarbamoyltransferase complex transferase subunit TsaD [Terriglobales bacterium]|nr:tRNA (adenosine(37)-N6)-threonylcarbamoyltransferase complex transferase subunit TsaD [Terriglobales bacterium]